MTMPTTNAIPLSPSIIELREDPFMLSDEVLAKAQNLFNRISLPIRPDEEFNADAKREATKATSEKGFLLRMEELSEPYPHQYHSRMLDTSDDIHGDPKGLVSRDKIWHAVHVFVQGPMTFSRLTDLFASLYRPSNEAEAEAENENSIPATSLLTCPQLDERDTSKIRQTRRRRQRQHRRSSQTTDTEQRKQYNLRSSNQQTNRIEKARKTRQRKRP